MSRQRPCHQSCHVCSSRAGAWRRSATVTPLPCMCYKKTGAGVLNDKCNIGGWLYIGSAGEQFYCFDRWPLESSCSRVAKAILRSNDRSSFATLRFTEIVKWAQLRFSFSCFYIISDVLTSAGMPESHSHFLAFCLGLTTLGVVSLFLTQVKWEVRFYYVSRGTVCCHTMQSIISQGRHCYELIIKWVCLKLH